MGHADKILMVREGFESTRLFANIFAKNGYPSDRPEECTQQLI